jgi:hypothetical protein
MPCRTDPQPQRRRRGPLVAAEALRCTARTRSNARNLSSTRGMTARPRASRAATSASSASLRASICGARRVERLGADGWPVRFGGGRAGTMRREPRPQQTGTEVWKRCAIDPSTTWSHLLNEEGQLLPGGPLRFSNNGTHFICGFHGRWFQAAGCRFTGRVGGRRSHENARVRPTTAGCRP